MKKLSTELWKRFIFLILIFITGYGFFAYSIWGYFVSESKKDIYITEDFLIEELKETEHQDIRNFFNVALRESPKINDLYISLSQDGIVYKEEGAPDIGTFQVSDDIQEIGYKDFFVMNKVMPALGGKEVLVTITRGMSKEKYFMEKILKMSVTGILVFCGAAFFISKSFQKDLGPQLKKLEEATNKVNLSSFESDIDKEHFFIEFSNVLFSYEKMLKRLETQASDQMDFVNNASHELKTPIFIIGSYVDLIKRWGSENEEISREALDSISSEVKNMRILIDKLLFLAKQDKVDPVREDVDLGELMENIIKEMEILHPEQSINHSHMDFHVKSDRELLKHLIKNILENALIYGDGKGVDISYDQGSNIGIKIRDHGNGMTQEEQNKIFDKFYRVEKSRNKEFGGHGLGLSIVKSIAEILKLDISFSSEVGRGTTVEISLPIN